ncbi:MAG: translation initiation factor IF-3 [Omnitrophica WOR_2 bacterium SM23_29]|nr:MAG: translation initiation factor IF-3 [Omnitrophica WOR_2 bacterium SM23_29]
MQFQAKSIRVNERIRTREIMVIGANGEQLGVMAPEQGLRLAQEGGLDLVEVAPQAKPPVCRIMDFSKYKYEQEKKAKEAKRKQHAIHIKEIRLKPKIGDHDYQVKLGFIKKFLERGDKVKITLLFRGREMSHPELGRKVLERLSGDIANVGEIEKPPLQEGRLIVMVVAPK